MNHNLRQRCLDPPLKIYSNRFSTILTKALTVRHGPASWGSACSYCFLPRTRLPLRLDSPVDRNFDLNHIINLHKASSCYFAINCVVVSTAVSSRQSAARLRILSIPGIWDSDSDSDSRAWSCDPGVDSRRLRVFDGIVYYLHDRSKIIKKIT